MPSRPRSTPLAPRRPLLIFRSVLIGIALLILIDLSVALGFTSSAQAAQVSSLATVTPTGQLPPLKLSKLVLKYDENTGTIQGNFNATNPTTDPLNNMYFTVTVSKELDQGMTDDLTRFVLPTLKSFAPGEQTALTFSQQLPRNLGTGKYDVLAEAFNDTGIPSGITARSFTLSTASLWKDRFISMDDPFILVDGQKVNPLSGPNLDAGTDVQIGFTLKNPHPYPITGTPRITIYPRTDSPDRVPLTAYNETTVTVPAGGEVPVNFTIASNPVPESYLATVQLYDSNQQLTSDFKDFRWVVKGESGKVLSTDAQGDRHFFKTVLNMHVVVIGPADGTTLKSVSLHTTVVDDAHPDRILFEQTRKLTSLGPNAQTLTLPITLTRGMLGTSHLRLTAQLLGSHGQQLASSSSVVVLHTDKLLIISGGVVLLLLLLLLLWFLIKKPYRARYVIVSGVTGFLIFWTVFPYPLPMAQAYGTNCQQIGTASECQDAWAITPSFSFNLSPDGDFYQSACIGNDTSGTTVYTCVNDTSITVSGQVTVAYYCDNVDTKTDETVSVGGGEETKGCFIYPGDTFSVSGTNHWAKTYPMPYEAPPVSAPISPITQSVTSTLNGSLCWGGPDCSASASASFTIQCINTVDNDFSGGSSPLPGSPAPGGSTSTSTSTSTSSGPGGSSPLPGSPAPGGSTSTSTSTSTSSGSTSSGSGSTSSGFGSSSSGSTSSGSSGSTSSGSSGTGSSTSSGFGSTSSGSTSSGFGSTSSSGSTSSGSGSTSSGFGSSSSGSTSSGSSGSTSSGSSGTGSSTSSGFGSTSSSGSTSSGTTSSGSTSSGSSSSGTTSGGTNSSSSGSSSGGAPPAAPAPGPGPNFSYCPGG